MIEIDREIIKKYPKFSPGIYEGENNDLYKICPSFPDKEQRINFLKYRILSSKKKGMHGRQSGCSCRAEYVGTNRKTKSSIFESPIYFKQRFCGRNQRGRRAAGKKI